MPVVFVACYISRMNLVAEIPDIAVFLGLPTEELAAVVLRVANSNQQASGLIHPQAVRQQVRGDHLHGGYSTRIDEAELAFDEAWAWLKVQGILISPTDPNGNNGWVQLSRRGRTLLDATAFRNYAAGVGFRQSFLHATIAEDVWFDLARGDHETAVFKSFRAVEIAVREAGAFKAKDIGADLMKDAFKPGAGPLTDLALPISEQEAMAAMFVAAIKYFKNPHSHRLSPIEEQKAAQEMVTFASHLLRIVDDRRADAKNRIAAITKP